jgi:hypothetical protein
MAKRHSNPHKNSRRRSNLDAWLDRVESSRPKEIERAWAGSNARNRQYFDAVSRDLQRQREENERKKAEQAAAEQERRERTATEEARPARPCTRRFSKAMRRSSGGTVSRHRGRADLGAVSLLAIGGLALALEFGHATFGGSMNYDTLKWPI